MKILVVVASKHGSTEEIAGAIGEELRSAGHVVELRHADEMPSVNLCDAVIIGSALYVGAWMKEARTYVEVNQTILKRKPVWLFSSGPLGEERPEPPDPREQIDELVELTGARGHRNFVGKLDKHSLGLGERLMVRMVKAPYGDFRDWDDIRAWAREIAAELKTLAIE